jgi:hypothetical protein
VSNFKSAKFNTNAFNHYRSDTDSGRSSDYRIEDNQQQLSKPLTLELESAKFFSLPRPKYNPKPEVVCQQKEIRLKSSSQNAAENRRGGRRFTVDVNSNDVANALADIGVKSRSSNNLNAIQEGGDFKISTLPNMKLKSGEDLTRNGPEFIANSNSKAKAIDITNNKVKKNISIKF